MGVIGLYSYLRRDPFASQAVKVTKSEPAAAQDNSSSSASALNDTSGTTNEPRKRYLIFDGNGLYHKLYLDDWSRTSRSLGGECTEFHELVKLYFTRLLSLNNTSSASQEEQISIRVIYDGAISNKEAKHETRVDRTNQKRDRVGKWKEMMEGSASAGTSSSSSTIRLSLENEKALPVPSISFIIFQQTLAALGITQWTSDGENDEHLAAIALHLQQEDPQCIVDIFAQDSDFMIFEMAQMKTGSEVAHTNNSGADEWLPSIKNLTISGKTDRGGYVPLETLRFDLDETTSACIGIRYQRYTTSTILAALDIPVCLLPTLACLIGNDSALDLDSFREYLRSPAFTSLLIQNKMALPFSMSQTVRNTNPDSIKANGGFQLSAQLVEMTLGYVRVVTKMLLREAAARASNDTAVQSYNPYSKQTAHVSNYETIMKELKYRLFGVRPSSSALVEQDLDPLHLFTTAQKKYSLKRFFTPIIKEGVDVEPGMNIFDPGFEVVMDDEGTADDANEKEEVENKNADEREDTFSTSSSSTSSSHLPGSAPLLLPSSFLSLYQTSSFSPQLLSIRLTRFFQAHVSIGHILKECVVHGRNGCKSTPASSSSASSSTMKKQPCECRTIDQCLRGLRKRVYERMFSIREMKPKRITSASSSSSSSSSSSAVTTSASSASSSSSPIIIREVISIISPNRTSNEEISSQEIVEMNITPHADSSSSSVTEDNMLKSYPKMFPALPNSSTPSPATSWSALFSILDVVPDLMLPSSSASAASSSQKQRITLLAQSMHDLAVVHQQPSFISLAMIYRTVFLHTMQSVLAMGDNLNLKMDASVQEELDRAVVGVNVLIALFAITYCKLAEKTGDAAASTAATTTSSQTPAPLAATPSSPPKKSGSQDIRSQDVRQATTTTPPRPLTASTSATSAGTPPFHNAASPSTPSNYTTAMCKNFLQIGSCRFGAACHFRHDEPASAVSSPAAAANPYYKSRPCTSFYQTGSCKNGAACTFRHDEPAPAVVTTPSGSFDPQSGRKLCGYYLKGSCRQGDSCSYLHAGSPAQSISTVTMNLDCIPLVQLFSDTYQWTMYALHVMRCEEYVKSYSLSPASHPPPSIPLVPLFYAFNGSSFHQYYARISDVLIQSRAPAPVPVAVPTTAATNGYVPPQRRLGTGNGIARGGRGGSIRNFQTAASPTAASTSAASSSSSSVVPPLPSATTSSFFSPSLLTPLNNLDSFIQTQCLQLLRDESASSSSLHSSMVSVYIAMKHAIWSSIGLRCNEAAVGDNIAAKKIPNIPSISITNGSAIPRTRLPYEMMSSSVSATAESHSTASSLHHSFSFCTSPTPPLPPPSTSVSSSSLAAPTPVPSPPAAQVCKFCGWLPYHANGTAAGDEGDAEEEDEEEDKTAPNGTIKHHGKKKRTKGGKKKGRR